MEQVQTLIHGKTIIPMSDHAKNAGNENNRVLTDCSIAIQDGRILDVSPTSEATKKYSSECNLDYKHHIIIPGLINAHTHAAMSLFRGLANRFASHGMA